MTALLDQPARTAALTELDRSILVEAGAGSGKTSLMAGRIAVMLAEGVDPRSVAAVSFTEMAASELVGRVTEFVDRLAADDVPHDLEAAFPHGVSAAQLRHLEEARSRIGDLTCTTIHGFCQRLLKPYPVEADIDPGARIIDPVEADLTFEDIFNDWLRDRLGGSDAEADMVTAFVCAQPEAAVKAIREIADVLRGDADAAPHAATLDPNAAVGFVDAARALRTFYAGLGFDQPETEAASRVLNEIADAIPVGASAHVTSVAILGAELTEVLLTQAGTIRTFRFKGKYQAAASTKKAGEALYTEALGLYQTCTDLLVPLRETAAGAALNMLVEEVRPLIDRYRAHKRAAALLDFDDLMVATRAMLRDHVVVRSALGSRYTRILVDEFQDTDPVQAEIFRLLAFDAPAGGGDGPWVPRPGAIFLVGDPKQAIYRFRGADVRAYLTVREAMRAVDPSSILEVGTNFRSCRSILEWVNLRFDGPLSVVGQPGFSRLIHNRDDRSGDPCVIALDVPKHDDAAATRDAEAELIADLCSRLVGSVQVYDKRSRGYRPCEPGDIALLAPQGTDLWRYETALENVGLSVSTQAGKGLFQRQEVQDLIALTRVLADPRDRLALGALLRGPLVGLTEEELLDVANALPPEDDGRLPLLRLGTPSGEIVNPIAREAIETLKRLASASKVTTPHDALSRAVEELRVRPILLSRHASSPERALANVDRFLDMARPYALRGLRAFSDTVRRAWEDVERLGEGRPDGEDRSISLITMHSAKGLEWPVVIPVNTMTEMMKQRPMIVDAATGLMSCPVLGVTPTGHDVIKAEQAAETLAERVRLWYVATTRARDVLIVPRHEDPGSKSWASVVNLELSELPALDPSTLPVAPPAAVLAVANPQTRASFDGEQADIETRRRPVAWVSPSRQEQSISTSVELSVDELIDAVPETDLDLMINGSKERGSVLHKLMEEILNGELGDASTEVEARAAELVSQILGYVPEAHDRDLDPGELSRTVARTLALPEIKAIRPRLVPEIAVGGVTAMRESDKAIYGVVDAAEWDRGRIETVVDWKSDVRPDPGMTSKYAGQVRSYLDTVGAKVGLIVFMTTGEVVRVAA